MSSHSSQIWQEAERLLHERRFERARAGYAALLDDPKWQLPAHLRLSVVALESGGLRESVAQALAAYALRDENPVLLEALCKVLINNGELQAALGCVTAPAMMHATDPQVLAGVGTMLGEQSFPEQSMALLERARQHGLDTPPLRRRIALSRMYAGDSDGAEREFEACLQADPDFAPAWRELSKLRRWTHEDNHVERLRAALARGGHLPTAPLLHYALFKELDDLGEYDAAWQSLQQGMAARRRQVHYDSAAEQALFDQLLQLCAAEDSSGAAKATDGPVPIFIVGMPRSGTTLLERILGAHSQIADAGELRDFTFQLRWCCEQVGPPQLDLELARRAEEVDWSLLGQRYLSHTQWHARGRAFYTDKLPANFVNVGYIARALPQARILHMVREPMDTCFSNLKEVFAEAYPHSYDQIEMADHFLRYQQLMAHWHAQFPGRIHDVHYDRLVTDPETVAREVLEFCGLPWEEGVVAIESRQGAVATASASQVREPIHQRFIGQWRKYEKHLQPMRERLEKKS